MSECMKKTWHCHIKPEKKENIFKVDIGETATLAVTGYFLF